MGMLAEYMMVDSKIVDDLLGLDYKELAEAIYDLEETEEYDSIELDKNWDALHYFLTGVTASEPIEGDKLSEAVVGVHNFSYEEDADFITRTGYNELKEIISALENFDPEEHKARLEKNTMKKMDLYPTGIGWGSDEENLYETLLSEIGQLIKFYKKAFETKQSVIISIL